ncbi:MAG: epoxyqueuosine reductase [Ruminococcaceae bacterium]|nr:epoxyqueuosine reductase [Oscillospiraceae bacterium]
MEKLNCEIIKEKIKSFGASDIGFAYCEDGPENLKYAISIVVALSKAIVCEIEDAPTHTYFNHYRTVNAHIDNILLKTGMFLQENGYNYITVAASQSINGYQGRYSHKKAACLSGMGSIGKNDLFIHEKLGCAVRLGTIFTDFPLSVENIIKKSLCADCDKCVKACPAMAIKGVSFESKEKMIDERACSEYMKRNFQNIGRGAVCGICMSVCPHCK